MVFWEHWILSGHLLLGVEGLWKHGLSFDSEKQNFTHAWETEFLSYLSFYPPLGNINLILRGQGILYACDSWYLKNFNNKNFYSQEAQGFIIGLFTMQANKNVALHYQIDQITRVNVSFYTSFTFDRKAQKQNLNNIITCQWHYILLIL